MASDPNWTHELALLYNHADNDGRQFTRWQMEVAIRHGYRLAGQVPRDVAEGWKVKAENLSAEIKAGRSAIDEVMRKHVENWPDHKKFSTTLKLLDKTLQGYCDQLATKEAVIAGLVEALELIASEGGQAEYRIACAALAKAKESRDV